MRTHSPYSVSFVYVAFLIATLILSYVTRQRAKKINATLTQEERQQCVAFNQSIPGYVTLTHSLLSVAPVLVTTLAVFYALYRLSFPIIIAIAVIGLAVEIITILRLSLHRYKKMIAFTIEEETAKRIKKHNLISALLTWSFSIILCVGIIAVELYVS